MDALMSEHAKAGCTKENEEEYMEEAKGVLDPGSVRQVQGRMQRR